MTNTVHEQSVLGAVPTELYVDGQWRPAKSGRTFGVEDPATGDTLTHVADGDASDAMAALDAAANAQDAWALHPPRARGEILRRTYELLTERVEDLALLMTMEMGKSLADSRAEIGYAAEFFRWFSEEAVRIDGRYTREPNGRGRLLVLQQPVGAVPADHPLELSDGHGCPQDCAGHRRRLHDDRQTGRAHSALHDRARRDPRRGRASRRRMQRGDVDERRVDGRGRAR